VAFDRLLPAAACDLGASLTKLGDERLHSLATLREDV
jgi:hypothetical protein